MTLKEAIELRAACRRYTGEPLEAQTAGALQTHIDGYNRRGGVSIQLIRDQTAVLNDSAGRFSGANSFFLLAGRGGDQDAGEKLGYYGEFLVLEAVSLGLGTCWVSGTYNGKAIHADIAGNERVFCVIALGKIPAGEEVREGTFGKVLHRQSKNLEEFYTASGPVPDWFMPGIDAVQKAPSAMNSQPVRFSWADGILRAEAAQPGRSLDLGIAKAHFEIGAGGGFWEWGNGGAYRR